MASVAGAADIRDGAGFVVGELLVFYEGDDFDLALAVVSGVIDGVVGDWLLERITFAVAVVFHFYTCGRIASWYWGPYLCTMLSPVTGGRRIFSIHFLGAHLSCLLISIQIFSVCIADAKRG